jgi:hypothetical protein
MCLQQHFGKIKNSFSIAKTFIGLLGIVTIACDSCIIQCIAVLATAY